MTIEQSKGKARPTLPRSSDLEAVGTVPVPSVGRAPAGRFGKGNRDAADSGAKNVLTKAMSPEGLRGDAVLVARDTRKLYLAVLRELPSKATVVRTNAYGHAREAALAAYYDSQANAAGLDTERGEHLVQRASYHRQRAERLSVTTVDLAAALPAPPEKPAWAQPAPAPTVQEREGGQRGISAAAADEGGAPGNFSQALEALDLDDLAPADKARLLRELLAEVEGRTVPGDDQGDDADQPGDLGAPSPAPVEPSTPAPRPLSRETCVPAVGVALPAHLGALAPFVPSPMHGGQLRPAHEAREMPVAAPPADLQARLDALRTRR